MGDYTALPFPDDAFKGVYAIEALVHAPDHEKALAEFLRVLEPGGKLVLFEYSMPAPKALSPSEREVFTAINTGSAMYSFPAFRNGEFSGVLTKPGFGNVSVEDISYRIEPMLRHMARICWLPYQIARLISSENRYLNARAAVEYYRLRDLMRYNIATGHKPTPEGDGTGDLA